MKRKPRKKNLPIHFYISITKHKCYPTENAWKIFSLMHVFRRQEKRGIKEIIKKEIKEKKRNSKKRCTGFARALKGGGEVEKEKKKGKKAFSTYLCQPHGCEPTGTWLFTVEGYHFEPGFTSLSVFCFCVTRWSQTNAPLEGCVEVPLCVRNPVYVVVRQVGKCSQLFVVLKQEILSISHPPHWHFIHNFYFPTIAPLFIMIQCYIIIIIWQNSKFNSLLFKFIFIYLKMTNFVLLILNWMG